MTTAYMLLTLPIVSTTLGPAWATQINAAITTIDRHDHTSNKGALVPTAGLNINSNLSFAGYSATNLKTAVFSSQGAALSAAVTDAIYVANGELYYNNGSGTSLKITDNGSLNASSLGGFGGDYATSTALAAYYTASKSFQYTQSSNVAALVDAGPVLIRKVTGWTAVPQGAGEPGVTIAVDPALTTPWTLTLQTAPPAANRIMVMDSSGNLSTPFYPDGTTIEIAGAVIQLKDASVTNAKVSPSAAIVKSKIEKPSAQIANGTVAFGNISATTAGTSIVAGDTVIIGGTTFTCVASGAGALQFNVGATNGLTLINLAAAINAYLSGGLQVYSASVYASGATTIVRVQVMTNGTAGNSTTLTQGGGGHFTLSGATFSGGSANGGGTTASSNVNVIVASMTFLAQDTRPTIINLQPKNPSGGLACKIVDPNSTGRTGVATITYSWYIDDLTTPIGIYSFTGPWPGDVGGPSPYYDVPLTPQMTIAGLTAGYHNIVLGMASSDTSTGAQAIMTVNCALSALEL